MPNTVLDRPVAILDAALACFDEHGIAGASIDCIRARSGASVGSIYHHFGGKEGIAAALYVEALRRYQEAFLAELEGHAGAEDGVRAMVAFHLRWHRRNAALARFLRSYDPKLLGPEEAGRLRELNHHFLGAAAAWWRTHVHYGELRELDLLVAHALWLGPAQEVCRAWLAGEIPARALERSADDLADGAWQAVRPPPKGTP
jgi:AcrR family transcriptional regulator